MQPDNGIAIDPWHEYRIRKNLTLLLALGMILIAVGAQLVLLRWALPLVVSKPILAMIYCKR
jgi:hypothetical protein